MQIQNIVDVRHHDNQELAMRFSTSVKNNRVFYTDLNGFDMRCDDMQLIAAAGPFTHTLSQYDSNNIANRLFISQSDVTHLLHIATTLITDCD